MKRPAIGLALFALLLAPGVSVAQEPPHLEFVHGLRSRGYHELALDYLQKLQQRKQPPLPKELAEVLPLEIARSQADVAGREQNSARRDQLIGNARKSFQDFVAKNPNHAMLGEAQLELGRMVFEQAKGKSFQSAMTAAGDKPAALALEKEARADFNLAEKHIVEAVKRLKERYDKPPAKTDRALLLGAYVNALWLLGNTRYERAMSYSDDADPKRGEDMKAASDALAPLVKEHRDHSSGFGWLAFALQGRCDLEQDKPTEAAEKFKVILAQTKQLELVVPAQRMARYYQMLDDHRRDRREALRDKAHAWIKDFGNTLNTREGAHVRYLLANSMLREVGAMGENQRKLALGQKLVDEAMKVYDSLSGTEYAQLASIEKSQILFLSGRAANRPIAELKTFDDLLLRAQLELQAAEEDRAKLAKNEDEAQEKKIKANLRSHHDTMKQAVQLSIGMMPENVKPDDYEKALTYLYLAYLRAGYVDESDNQRPDPLRAAIVAEHLARTAKKPDTGPKAAAAALEFYMQASASGDAADQQRVVAVAELMEKKWPNALQTDAGRDLLAKVYFQQQKLREAAALWQKVSPKNPAFASASYFAGITFWRLHYESARSAKKPVTAASADRDLAVALLERSLKTVDPAKASGEELKTYIQAAVSLADIYALIGKAEDARKLVDPLADRVAKGSLPGDLPPNTRPRILSLALRTNVQRRDDAGLKRALAVLDIMKKQGADDLGGGLNQILMEMGTQLKSQIAALEQEGDAAKTQLEQTKQSFGKFLDHLNADRGKLDANLQIWLATSYGSLDQHAKSVEILRSFREPPANADQAARTNFQRSQLLLPRALRQAKQFTEADKQLRETMTKRDWARRHPEFHKERILLLQDQNKLSGPTGAIAEWTKLIQSLQPLIDRGGVIREVFNESNFHLTYCRYLEAKRLPDRQERDTTLKQVAQTILALEKNDFGGPEHRRRFEELLNNPDHADLRAAYQKLNGGK